MIQKSMAAALGVCILAMAQACDAQPFAAADFDMAAYLAALSAEGKERGYKEFVYKQTPQGELRMYFKMPTGWSSSDKRPAMAFFYGGGWSNGKVFACVREAEHFAQRGMVVGLADYRVRTRHGVAPDKCAEDARSVVRWVRANCTSLGVDPDRIIAGGGSAGGHIAACTAIANGPNSATDDVRVSCLPNGLLLYYPVASLVDDIRANAFKRLLGEELALKLSPARNVTKSWPPTVMFSGTADIERANGILLHNQAQEAGVGFELYLAEGRGHGVASTAPRDFGWLLYASDFFRRAGLMDQGTAVEELPGELRRYNGEPVAEISNKPDPSRIGRKRAGKKADAAPINPPPAP